MGGGDDPSIARANGGPVSVAGGNSNTAGSLTLGIDTSAAGSRNGTVGVDFTSVPTVTGLDSPSLGSGSITVTGQVNTFAAADFDMVSGDGTFTGSGTSYTLDLGSINQNSGTLAQNLSLTNIGGSLAFTDLLDGSYDLTGSGSFNLSGFSACSLGGGASQSGLQVALDSTLAANTYAGTITLTPHSTNASGYDGALSEITINLTGTITATVVPEPATLGLLGVAAAGMLARRRRTTAG